MEQLKTLASCCKTTAKVLAKDPPRTLRTASATAGFLLILGGIVGVFTINPLAAVISVYNVFFGVLIVLTELKTMPIIRTFQKRVDIYFHLLSVPRGKGGFYCFIGLLAFFAEDGYISLVKVCVIIVSIVGLIHLFACKRCGAMTDEEYAQADKAKQQHEMQGIASLQENGSADSNATVWGSLMKQVVSDSPEVLSYGLSAAANPDNQSALGAIGAAALGGCSGGSATSGAMGSEPAPACATSGAMSAAEPGGLNRSSTL